ncbi:hypothetical protein I9H06_00350 [Pseudomonas tremae]|uniref:FAD-dependent oxidoreductase n=1 Tax=Pseudomonas tremae TaxID=200454 RepID=UPI001F40E77D|nr:FAD-dependent oxidoreductase [Pseudomonas tremae]MCF5714923.1 FAD-dependent oxidoreductase [Pseudomonas tremae]UQB31812.1 hypothetical protein I9H06_00350 [Pseudomonas tremae]
MTASFDFCVIGNGPLGAAAALYIAEKGASVCLVGASPKDRVCSHNDHSRIYRTQHADSYWTTLAKSNLKLMLDLQKSTDICFFRPTPVYYDGASTETGITTPPLSYLTLNRLTHQDTCGGIIDPLLYIDALNKAARRLGADIRKAIVMSVQPSNFGYELRISSGDVIKSQAVVDFRGLHAAPIGEGATIARTIILAQHPPLHEPHCFIRTELSDSKISEFFACSHIATDSATQLSKFVFADADSVFLYDSPTLQAWFERGYRTHPKISWALEEIQSMGFVIDIDKIQLAPCAFTRTPDGRPRAEKRRNYLSFYGCNGSAAKCAQSLAETIISQHFMSGESMPE